MSLEDLVTVESEKVLSSGKLSEKNTPKTKNSDEGTAIPQCPQICSRNPCEDQNTQMLEFFI